MHALRLRVVLMSMLSLAPTAHAVDGMTPAGPALDPRVPVPPAYADAGYRIGGFLIEPRLTSSLRFDDNIFAAAADRRSDMVANLGTNAFLRSNWSRHALSAYVDLGRDEYVEVDDESTNRFLTEVSGRLDLPGDTALGLGLLSLEAAEPRTAAAALPNALRPVQFRRHGVYASASREQGRFKLHARVDGNQYDFDDASLLGGGESDQDDRNRDALDLRLRAGVRLDPGTTLFLQAKGKQRNYTDTPAGQSARDSQGGALEIGIGSDTAGPLRYELAAGYLSQSYDSPEFRKVEGPSLDASLGWALSGLSKLKLSASRGIQDAAISGAAGYRETAGSAVLEHELLRSLLLSLEAKFGNDDYQGIDRRDRRVAATFLATWFLNRFIHLTASVQHHDLDSTGAASRRDFSQQTVAVGLVLHR